VAWVAGLGSVPAWEAWKAAARFLGLGIPLVPASGDLGLGDGIPLVPGSGKLAWVAMMASPVCRIAHVEALGGRSAKSVCPGFELLVAPGSSCLDSDGSDLVKAAISVMGGAGKLPWRADAGCRLGWRDWWRGLR